MNKLKIDDTTIDLLDSPLKSVEFTVFDLETTGIHPQNGDRILEIGAIKLTKNFRVSKNKFHRLIKSDVEVPEESFKIHGISTEELKKGEDECVALYDFFDFARGTVLVAHNASKDIAFIKHTLKEYMVENPFNIVIDTLRLSRKSDPLAIGHNLDKITERFNININSPFKRHRALYDAEVTVAFFKIVLKSIFKAKNFTLLELIEFIEK